MTRREGGACSEGGGAGGREAQVPGGEDVHEDTKVANLLNLLQKLCKTFPVLRLVTFTTAKSFVPERLNFLINILGVTKKCRPS